VANPEHLELLRQGVEVWNAWRVKDRSVFLDLVEADLGKANVHGANLRVANLSNANLHGANLSGANLTGAKLGKANLTGANLSGANLTQAKLGNADLTGADLRGADLIRAKLGGAKLSVTDLAGANLFNVDFGGTDLTRADLTGTNLTEAKLGGANLTGAFLSGAGLSNATLSKANLFNADLTGANLRAANLSNANLHGANLSGANLTQAKLGKANLTGANLFNADLTGADLRGANLTGADLSQASLIVTDLADTTLTDCRIYSISAWDVRLSEGTKQQGLIITRLGEPAVTVDDLEVAQFVYLLLHNDKIRRVIDTVGKKGVLLLGRFTEGRIVVLERLREELRKRGYLPIVFNFDKPETKDFTETVRLLAGLSKFVIADITNPKSAPLELQATVPDIMVPFLPIIEEGEKPFAMLQDLWIKHRDWVFEPIYYSSVDALIASLDEKIIRPAEARFVELVKRKADTMGEVHV
jgi:uncharacterized protein YjbI with pentapeptide repeats